MRKNFSIVALTLLSILLSEFFSNANAQEISDSPFKKLEVIIAAQRPPQRVKSSNLKDIQVFGASSGIAFTRDSLFRTDDNGETWREIALPKKFSETISTVSFLNENIGWAILADEKNERLELAKTNDGGNSWTKTPIDLRNEDLHDADLTSVSLEFESQSLDRNALLTIRSQTSSNFFGRIVYESVDGGNSWQFLWRNVWQLFKSAKNGYN